MSTRNNSRPTSSPRNASPRRLRSSTTPCKAFQEPVKTSQNLLNHSRKVQKRKYAAGNQHKPTSPPKNASPRRLRSSITPSKAFQEPSKTCQNLSTPTGKAQKRNYFAEIEPLQKRLREDLSSTSVPAAVSQDLVDVWQTRGKKRPYEFEDQHLYERRQGSVEESRLSEENLKKLEKAWKRFERGTSNEMDSSVTSPSRVRKRAPSRQVSLSDLNQDTVSSRSPKSSASNSVYRYSILDQARVFIFPELPPISIRAQMDVIFKRDIPEKRRREISGVAEKISQDFSRNLRGPHREDDLVELIHQALYMMQDDEIFHFLRKADWDPSLKPNLQEGLFNFDFLRQSNNETNDAIDRSNKRQHGEQPLPSPDTSRMIMPPPGDLSQFKRNAIKTPRPDFTIGFIHSIISDALIKRGLSKPKADNLLKDLQRQQMLCSDPTQALNVRFPMLVIEGKSYATGKTVFEAQNQAAVSGSCMVNLQQQWADILEGVFPNLKVKKAPLAFSICTQGPQIEFWVHYALLEDNVRSHYMNIFRTCYGSLQGGLEDFLIDVECLMVWMKHELLEEVADQLYKLAKHAGSEQCTLS